MPEAVPGIEIRSYRHPEEARAFYAAQQESFADHWEHRPMPWEKWGAEALRPRDVRLDALVGCRGPRRGRRRPSGRAAPRPRPGLDRDRRRATRLPPPGDRGGAPQDRVAEFFRRGERRIGLGVDAESPTGATRVYERAGCGRSGTRSSTRRSCVQLREPTREDAPAIAELLDAHSGNLYGERDLAPATISDWFTLPDIWMRLAEAEGRPVGYADLSRRPDAGASTCALWTPTQLGPARGGERARR